MAGNPHPVFVDNVPVEKANARAYLPLRLGNPDALRALDGSTFWLCYIQTLLAFFYRDTSDTTSADNGTSVIVDGNGGIWKFISSGAGIAISAAGPVADRGDFDSEDPGFTYFGTDTELLYVRVTGGGWSAGSTITGAAGEDGATWLSGSSDPSNGWGADGDFYLQTGAGVTGVAGDTWKKASGSWSKQVNLKGPQGDPSTVPGPSGTNGTNGASSLTVVRLVATSNVTISSGLENGDTVDGVTLVTGDLVLLAGQSSAAENGIYQAVASGSASRLSAFNTYDSMPGCYFSVMEGTAGADKLYRCTSNKGGTLGTTALAFSEFTSGGSSLPTGGTTGQVLAKASGTDYDTDWVDQSGGGQPVFTPEQYGAVGDGSTDDSTAINDAITAAGTGGIVEFGAKTYAVESTINIETGVILRGRQTSSAFGTYSGGSVLKWTGASAGKLMYFGCPIGGTGDLKGGALRGLVLDGNFLADTVLHTRSCQNSILEHLAIVNPRDNSSAKAWLLDSDVQARTGDINAIYGCSFNQMIVDAGAGAAHGVWITGASDETSGKHPAFCNFNRMHITHDDGDALHINSADNLSFYGFGSSKISGGTGKEIYVDGSSSSPAWHPYACTWFGVQITTNDTPTILFDGQYAKGHRIYALEGIDLAPVVTISNSAELFYDYTGASQQTALVDRAALNIVPPLKINGYASTDPKVLDWYEEKTGTIAFSFNNGTTGMVGNTASFTATRIGNHVFAKIALNLTTKGSSTGVAQWNPFPFWPPASTAGGVIYATGLASGVGTAGMVGLVTTGGGPGAAAIYKMVSGAMTQMTNSDFADGSVVQMYINYFTNG